MNRKLIKRNRQRGAVTTEYIIILILVSLSLIVVASKFGKALITKFGDNTQIQPQPPRIMCPAASQLWTRRC